MANLPYISQYICSCILDADYEKVFLYSDYSITPLTKSIPIKIGNMQVNSKSIPIEVQEHTSSTLQKMVTPPQKSPQSPSFSQTTPSTLSTSKSCTSYPTYHNISFDRLWDREMALHYWNKIRLIYR